ncbi:Z1 domain-containing protein [Companilactobacillus zhachilii]|uniref:Z1 domain-containing protein n=1 Tax=Companilactobacillus zhachilii TaxID=2304606 RepID=UPI00403343C9
MMNYLDDYLEQFKRKGKDKQALSIKKTATEVGNKYLKQFDFSSNKIGLLFGNIQSGKTGQMFGIASEAADRGFPYFLLLETDSTLLQQQTYERAKRDLPHFVICSEKEEQKFRNHGSAPVMIVIKKNSRILKLWMDILKNSKMLAGNPLFILDDEADASSLNTKVNKKVGDKESTINKYLNSIRTSAMSSMYLQVTGTPQALLLQSIESNWKPMFTYYFKPGDDYLGGNFFFNKVSNSEFIRLTDEKTPITIAKSAVIRHLVVSAQVLLSGGHVSNCLVHPDIRQLSHSKAREDIESAMNWWTYHHNDPEFEKTIKKEYELINPSKSEKKPYNDIYKKVLKMLEKREYSIVTLNGTSIDSNEDYVDGCNFIIGGTNLGRGVTFDQLNTFIYTRTSKNPQADTMWQHSRIFGYDRDPGLISVYMSAELYKLFYEINETNNSLINQAINNNSIKISYPDKLKPTRSNILDKSLLNILVGGSNHFPLEPSSNVPNEIDSLLKNFDGSESTQIVSLRLILEILYRIKCEKSFNLDGYKDMILSEVDNNSLAQGGLLVRRNRDITHNSRALLSPNDWADTNKYDDKFVLTMYKVKGSKSKGWNGNPVWVPNIKLPKAKNFYII